MPEELYKAIVEIYVYFLQFDPATGERRAREEAPPPPPPDEAHEERSVEP